MATPPSPTLRIVRNELHDARVKWYDIGLELEIEEGDLRSLRKQYGDPSDALREMLSIWLKKTGGSWEKIVEALKAKTVGEDTLAVALEKKYCQRTAISNDPTGTGKSTTS